MDFISRAHSLPADFAKEGHPRQTAGRPSHRPRGSGALPAFADILLELRMPPGDPPTLRRELPGIGRYPEKPRRLLLEMNADATGYAVLAEPPLDDPGFAAALDHLRTARRRR